MKLQRGGARADAQRLAVVEIDALAPSPPVPGPFGDPLPVLFGMRRAGVG